MTKQLVIGLDVDGTLFDHVYPDIVEVPGALYWLRQFVAHGAVITLSTCRTGGARDQAVSYLMNAGLVTIHCYRDPLKPVADIYIDDRGVGCPLIQPEGFAGSVVDWSVVGPEVLHKVKQRNAIQKT